MTIPDVNLLFFEVFCVVGPRKKALQHQKIKCCFFLIYTKKEWQALFKNKASIVGFLNDSAKNLFNEKVKVEIFLFITKILYADRRDRTGDQWLIRPTLYLLSYASFTLFNKNHVS